MAENVDLTIKQSQNNLLNSCLKVRGKKRKTESKGYGREKLVKAAVGVNGRKQKSP